MQKTSDTIVGLVAIGVAVGAALILLTPVPAITIGAAFTLLSAVLLSWKAAAVASSRRAGAVALVRAPWVLLGLNVLVIGASLLPMVIPVTRGNTGWLFLPMFLTTLGYMVYLPSTLLFWVADDEGLTQQVLSFKKTFAWHTIDWVYPARQKTTQTALNIPIVSWTEETLIVEAGPRQSMRVVLHAPLVKRAGAALFEAIRTRASEAAFGFDQLPAVHRRRNAANAALSAGTVAPTDLAGAVRQAATGVVPNGWTVFPMRLGSAWANLLSLTVLGLALIVAGIYLFANGTIIGGGFIPLAWRTPTVQQIASIVQLVLTIVVGLVLLRMGVRWLGAVRNPRAYFFLVTPEYFAEAKGDRIKGGAFANVRGVSTQGGGALGLQIVVGLRDGKKVTYDFGKAYGPVRDIYSYLLNALNAQRAPQGARTGMGAADEIEG